VDEVFFRLLGVVGRTCAGRRIWRQCKPCMPCLWLGYFPMWLIPDAHSLQLRGRPDGMPDCGFTAGTLAACCEHRHLVCVVAEVAVTARCQPAWREAFLTVFSARLFPMTEKVDTNRDGCK